MATFTLKKALTNHNIQESLLFFILACALLLYSLTLHYGTEGLLWKLSPYLFPALVGLLLFMLALSLLGEGLHQLRSGTVQPKVSGKNTLSKGGWVTLGATVLYLLLLPLLTFLPATVLFLAGLFLYLGERRWWLVALLSLGTAGGCYLLFDLLLQVMLP